MSTNRRHLRTVAGAALAGGALTVGAVFAGSGDDRVSAPDGPTVTTVAEAAPTIDWARPEEVELGGGWSVIDTEGDAPMVTVLRNGRTVGILEYLDYPLEGSAGDDRAALDDHVGRFFRDIGADRARTPIDGYRFEPDPVAHATASDGAIVRYGFRATLPDGSPSERTIQWAGIRAGRLVLVSAAANDPGGLFPPEGPQFTSAQLDEATDRLDRLVRASGLPLPQPLP